MTDDTTKQIIRDLAKHRSRNLIIRGISEKYRLAWDDAERLVARVEEDHQSTIYSRWKPVYIFLGIVIALGGLTLAFSMLTTAVSGMIFFFFRLPIPYLGNLVFGGIGILAMIGGLRGVTRILRTGNPVNEKQTYLKQAGQFGNPAVLLLHGIGADHQMWTPQISWLADQGYFVLAPDLLGHGKSPKAAKLELTDWENQILAILEEKGITGCTLIGASMGGVIAQSFAANHPEMVHKLILTDTFGELRTIMEKVLGVSQVLGFRLYQLLGAKALAKGMASAYKASHARLAREYFSQASINVDFGQLILARKAINRANLIGRIDGSRIPTMVLVGADFGRAFVKINRKIADAIQGSEFVILENAMDPSNLVNPERFNHEVLQFLKS